MLRHAFDQPTNHKIVIPTILTYNSIITHFNLAPPPHAHAPPSHIDHQPQQMYQKNNHKDTHTYNYKATYINTTQVWACTECVFTWAQTKN